MKTVRRKGTEVNVTGGGGSQSTKYPMGATKFDKVGKDGDIKRVATLAHGIIERVRKEMLNQVGKWQLTMLGMTLINI